MRPSNKTWSLTVRDRFLHLDAPHGSFPVRAIVPEVRQVVEALPDGTDVECEGSYDGGGTISHLVVTKVRRILKDMRGRVLSLPDAVIAADGRLAAARARHHLVAGNAAAAAKDIASLLHLGDDAAIGEYERLPPEMRAPLLDALVAWQAARPASWRALRHVPIERWQDQHLDGAVEEALASGGVFGAAPGIPVELLLDELERRGQPTRTRSRQTQRLRRAQATEGDTFHRLVTDLEDPRVIGADAQGFYIAGTAKFGEGIVQTGAHRRLDVDRRAIVAHYDLAGGETRRWEIAADRVVEGVALQLEADEPAGVRLSDGKPLFTFAYRIQHHDAELLWGIHERDETRRVMRSEIRHIATGYTIAELAGWVDDVQWNAKEIYVHGDAPQTLTREGRFVSGAVPPTPPTIGVESEAGLATIPAAHAPWRFGSWDSQDAGGWVVHHRGRQLYLAPSEPGATWTYLEMSRAPARVDLAPPWLAFHGASGPIIAVALAEAISAREIRVDGKRFARRGKSPPQLAVSRQLVALHETLVQAGIAPRVSEVERDAHLYRVFEGIKELPDDALARVLIDRSPRCIAHSDYYVYAEDGLYEQVSRALGDTHVRETSRRDEETDDEDVDNDDDDDADVTITLEATRDGRRVERRTRWGITSVMTAIDAMLAQLGSPRRIYALSHGDWNVRVYLVITPEERRAIVAAGIEGIRADARS